MSVRRRGERVLSNSRVAALKQIVISACTAIFAKLGLDPGVEKKTVSEGVKHTESLPRNFCGLVIHIKITFCKKNGSKRSLQPSAVFRPIYPPSIWGPSRQLDDQHRNTNMKNKDHLVGQLTIILDASFFLRLLQVQQQEKPCIP